MKIYYTQHYTDQLRELIRKMEKQRTVDNYQHIMNMRKEYKDIMATGVHPTPPPLKVPFSKNFIRTVKYCEIMQDSRNK